MTEERGARSTARAAGDGIRGGPGSLARPSLRTWLRPGMGVKRWLLVVFLGELGLALAGALVLRQVYRDIEVEGPLQAVLFFVTLQFLPYVARGAILAGLGTGLFLYGSLRLIRALTDPLRGADHDQPLVEVIYQKRVLARGPRIVAIGGGTGLSVLLRGLKEQTSNLTAIVSVADDGGSSGVLRGVLGVPPVGDIRNCLVALADAEPLMGRLLQYRFPGPDGGAAATDGGDPPAGDGTVPDRLAGHAVGNLLIAAMAAIEGGDFEEGVRQMNRVLAVRGRVLPVSPVPLTLHARLRDGRTVDGQSAIARSFGIEAVWLTPEAVPVSAEAIAAIGEAEAIVLGPGSLFTSVLPPLLLPPIRRAVAESEAVRIYVCNVATQLGETSGFDLADHVEALARAVGPDLVDVVVANSALPTAADGPSEPVRLRWPPAVEPPPKLVLEAVVDPANPHHHDPTRLAAAILAVLDAERRARRRPAVRSA
jgi:uncharacterized cofD-like protein